MSRSLKLFLFSIVLGFSIFLIPQPTWAYPFWAQQKFENPREATGKIVCANCHVASMPTRAEVPQAVAADSVFKTVVEYLTKTIFKKLELMAAKFLCKLERL